MKTPPWLKTALSEIGVKEVVGKETNPRIALYHSITTLRATSDEVPWCASFACWVLERGGVPSPRSSAARSFLKWGLPLAVPFIGCVVVISRGGDPAQGHVGFWFGENDEHVFILAGNQGDAVNIQAFDKKRVLGYRAPDEKYWGQSATH